MKKSWDEDKDVGKKVRKKERKKERKGKAERVGGGVRKGKQKD